MDYVIKNNRKLRTGITTGTCAAAAAKAAALLLLTDQSVGETTVETNRGAQLSVPIDHIERKGDSAEAVVVKDSGDDPDVTNGIEIIATVSLSAVKGVRIDGGRGVGRVTRPGLKIPVGRAAINPAPMAMIRRELERVCEEANFRGGLDVAISVPKGEEIARKTMNARLGIEGGLSILGTTGIVEPMSEKALVDTLKTEIDMHVHGGRKTLLVTPGNYGREFARSELGFDMEGAVKCSNFIGEVLDYARFIGLEKIVLVGHAGKLIKLAGGIMNTHSSMADCRMEIFAAHAAMFDVPGATIRAIMDSVTVDAAMNLIGDRRLLRQIWESIGRKIAFHLDCRTKGMPRVELVVFTLEEGVLIHT